MVPVLTILLIVIQVFQGMALLSFWKLIEGNFFKNLALSWLIGFSLSTLELFLLELVGIRISLLSVLAIQVLAFLLLTFGLRKKPTEPLRELWALRGNLKFKIYDLPFLLTLLLFWGISAWRCYYNPPSPFDTLVGIDLVAKYAVKEGTIANSVYFQHLTNFNNWSNQAFYAPLTMIAQVLFRLSGLVFGKIWLSLAFGSFLIILFHELKDRIHSILAGWLVIILVAAPEFFAYSFLIQTDFINAVFFTLGALYLFRFHQFEEKGFLWLSSFFMGIACWARTETIFFVPFLMLVLWQKEPLKQVRSMNSWLLLLRYGWFPVFAILIWNNVYVPFYLPVSSISTDLFQTQFDDYGHQVSTIISSMFDSIIWQDIYWGYIIYIFIAFAVINTLLFRDYKGSYFLYAVTLLFVVFVLMLVHIKGANIAYTFRRGFFKFLPLFILYMGHTTLLAKVSVALSNWEQGLNKKPDKKGKKKGKKRR